MKAILFTLCFIYSCFSFSLGEMRQWTNNQGKSIQAEFVSKSKDKVSLKTSAGKVVQISLASLSKKDQEHIEQISSSTASNDTEAESIGQNYNDAWPKMTRVVEGFEAETIEEGPDNFIYETPHFRFICDTKIGKNVIKQLALLFEATHEANQSIPIGNIRAHRKDLKFVAHLIENIDDYHAKGGLSGSAGVYYGSANPNDPGKTLVPFSSLGMRKAGKSYTVDRSKSSKTLIHELTHQLMTFEVKAAGWFSEGSAEYVACTPYNNGKFNFAANKKSIINFATAYDKKYKIGRALGTDIKAPSLEKFMLMPYEEFTGDKASFNYGFSLLLVYYWYHMDGEGDAKRIKEYIKALDGKQHHTDANKKLLDGRSFEELEKEIQQKWRRSGIKITFPPSSN